MGVITCDCEVYEICPSCAPSPEAYQRALIAVDEVKAAQVVEQPRYTLTDLRALAAEYADERHCEAKLAVQLSLSCFCEWIQRREQGKER